MINNKKELIDAFNNFQKAMQELSHQMEQAGFQDNDLDFASDYPSVGSFDELTADFGVWVDTQIFELVDSEQREVVK